MLFHLLLINTVLKYFIKNDKCITILKLGKSNNHVQNKQNGFIFY